MPSVQYVERSNAGSGEEVNLLAAVMVRIRAGWSITLSKCQLKYYIALRVRAAHVGYSWFLWARPFRVEE